MNDQQAAEAAGLNPNTAAYTKSRARIRNYMDQHRAAVSEKLVAQEVEGLRRLHISRDQILGRLWQLANLSPEETRGSIAGQVKAMGMLLAVEGLLPDRRTVTAPEQPAVPAPNPNIYVAEWLRERQERATENRDTVTATEMQPPAPPEPPASPQPENQAATVCEDNPSSFPKDLNWVPNAIGPNLDAYPSTSSTFKPPFAASQRRFGRGR